MASSTETPNTKPATIDRFEGEWAFLSNFSHSPLWHEGLDFPTVEHAFQATKTLNHIERHAIAAEATPGKAKRRGRAVTLRPDWEQVKVGVMKQLVTAKFMENPELARKLLATGQAELIEGNTWNDTQWGQVDGHGENYLGRILMQVRTEIGRLARNRDDLLIPHLIFTKEDVLSIADEEGIPHELAMERVGEWSKQIGESAVGLVNQLLTEVIRTGQP